jgi:hypothetical protein
LFRKWQLPFEQTLPTRLAFPYHPAHSPISFSKYFSPLFQLVVANSRLFQLATVYRRHRRSAGTEDLGLLWVAGGYYCLFKPRDFLRWPPIRAEGGWWPSRFSESERKDAFLLFDGGENREETHTTKQETESKTWQASKSFNVNNPKWILMYFIMNECSINPYRRHYGYLFNQSDILDSMYYQWTEKFRLYVSVLQNDTAGKRWNASLSYLPT